MPLCVPTRRQMRLLAVLAPGRALSSRTPTSRCQALRSLSRHSHHRDRAPVNDFMGRAAGEDGTESRLAACADDDDVAVVLRSCPDDPMGKLIAAALAGYRGRPHTERLQLSSKPSD